MMGQPHWPLVAKSFLVAVFKSSRTRSELSATVITADLRPSHVEFFSLCQPFTSSVAASRSLARCVAAPLSLFAAYRPMPHERSAVSTHLCVVSNGQRVVNSEP